MEYTREQAEQVLLDWNEFIGYPRQLYSCDIDFLNHKFTKLQVGKWYKNPNGVGLWFAKRISQPYHGTYVYGYGIHSDSKTWCNDEISNVGCVIKQGWIPATDKEVQEDLISEWEKTNPKFDFYTFDVSENKLYGRNISESGSIKLFDNGEWMKIDQPKPKPSYTISSTWNNSK